MLRIRSSHVLKGFFLHVIAKKLTDLSRHKLHGTNPNYFDAQDTFTISFSFFLRELVLFFLFYFFCNTSDCFCAVKLLTLSVLRSSSMCHRTCTSWSHAKQIYVPDVFLFWVLVFLLFLLRGIIWRLQKGQLLWSPDVWGGVNGRQDKTSGRMRKRGAFNIRSDKDVLFITLKHSREQKQRQKWNSRSGRPGRNALSIRQISDTALKTTLEKLTVILIVFMLGSCSSKGLCWGV